MGIKIKNCRAINANFDTDIPMIHLLWRGEDTWRIGVLLFALVTRNRRLWSVHKLWMMGSRYKLLRRSREHLRKKCGFSIVCHNNCELWFIQEQNYKVQWCLVCQQRHLHLTLIFLMCWLSALRDRPHSALRMLRGCMGGSQICSQKTKLTVFWHQIAQPQEVELRRLGSVWSLKGCDPWEWRVLKL